MLGARIALILLFKYRNCLTLSSSKECLRDKPLGIVTRTAQHYVKTYKDDEEKRLHGTKMLSRLGGGNSRKLDTKHTDFLYNYYDTAAAAVLWETETHSFSPSQTLKSITLSGLQKHLVQRASLTLKKLDRIVAARTSEGTLNQRREKILMWMDKKEMEWQGNCVFIDEAGFNMPIRRNFGRSKRRLPAKTVIPSNRGIFITIIGAICEKEVVDLILRKPKAVQKKSASTKKRKRGNDEAVEVPEVNQELVCEESISWNLSVVLWIHLTCMKCLVVISS